jgi:protein phosphatase
MMMRIKEVTFEQDHRILSVSDLHGGFTLFKQLLKKVNYNPEEDYLVILGDFLEKGPEVIALFYEIKRLSEQYEKVIVLAGNCDLIFMNLIVNRTPELTKHYDYYLNRPRSMFYGLVRKAGLLGESDYEVLRHKLYETYKDELNWVRRLPYLVESQDFIFVHAGIENRPDYLTSNQDMWYRIPYFYLKGHQAPKTVVCGHCPVALYSTDTYSENIIIDLDNRIINIDGGYSVKSFGQINMLIINSENGKTRYETAYVDDLPEGICINDQEGTLSGPGIMYPNYEIEILNKGTDFTTVKSIPEGKVMNIKNEYIINKGGKYFSEDACPSNILNLKAGETVKIIDDQLSGYALVKASGIVGWMPLENLKVLE